LTQIIVKLSFVHIVQYFSLMKGFFRYLLFAFLLAMASPLLAQKKNSLPASKKNTAPEIKSFTLDGKSAGSRIKLNPQEKYMLSFVLFDAEGDKIDMGWELFSVTALERDKKAEAIANAISPVSRERAMLHVPIEEGEYILWLYVNDGKGNTNKSSIKFTVLPN